MTDVRTAAKRWIAARLRRPAVLLASSLLGVGPPTPGASVHAAPAEAFGGDVIQEGCREVFAFVDVPAANVRPHVPSTYTFAGPEGTAQLFVTARSCDGVVVVGGEPGPGVEGRLAVTVADPARPDLDPTDQLFCCHWYVLFWVTDHQELSGWLKEGTGLGGSVRRVEDMALSYAPPRVHFRAGSPTPSPFTLDAAVNEPRSCVFEPADVTAGCSFRVSYWVETEEGTVRFAAATDSEVLDHGSGVVTPDPGTQMWEIFGRMSRPFASPISSAGFSSGSTTKEVIG